MALTPGTRLGVYEVTAQIGEGGMGQVFRATDTTLGRQVAIKILPDAFAADPDRMARFEREAQTLASLNHPHIAAIYAVEKSAGMHALVMELVEGDDLSQRIARGAIPLDEALPIARQIAEALEAAHEQGIIHRDLKPANIKITPDGVVKVLDFGLAKLTDPAHAPASDRSLSPTITSPAMMTGVGVILGTAAYMSPEQAKGRPADKRSDIWAFGCVLFEMLTGKRAFVGDEVSDVLASVLAREPDWSTLPTSVPGSIRALIRHCLLKDRRKRIADIAVALFAIDEASVSGFGTAAAATLVQRPLWRRVVTPVAAALVASIVVGAGVWFVMHPPEPMPLRVSRLPLAPSSAAALTINFTDRDLAITPDGSRVVYLGNRGTQLFVRALDALEPVVVFTGAPRGPFVSPDGQWIGFVDGANTLKKVAVTGGPPITLATLDGGSRGATWGSDDTIFVATNSPTTGLQRIAAAGGPVTVLTRPDRAQGESDHFWPEMLPGGRAVLFTITAVAGGIDAAQVAVLDLQTGMRKIVVRGASDAHYVPGGHLVYAAAGTLRAVPFDLATLETRGTPGPVVPDVVTTNSGGVDAVVAGNGTLAYVSGGRVTVAAPRTLVWVDRQGHEEPIKAPVRAYTYPRISPDGTRIALDIRDQENDIWIWDFGHETLTRVTFDPGLDREPVWTPDGRRVLFTSERAGAANNIFWQAADGTGSAERLTQSPNTQYATSVSPDGTRLVLREQGNRPTDLMMLALDKEHRVQPLIQTPYTETNGEISPDGRWLAYESNTSGQNEIYVRPFPNVDSSLSQVSTGGGTRPLWARSGQELFYRSPTGAVMSVRIERGATWAARTPTKLFEGPYFFGGGNSGRTYDVSPDGQRFLMIKEGGGTDQAAAPPALIVVQHWDEELKRLVPTK